MMRPGEIISYMDMCQIEGVNLQRGMNYHLKPTYSVILMSQRVGAPYKDIIEPETQAIIYEGHDISRRVGGPDPKTTDQPYKNPNGSFTQNGLFAEAAKRHKEHKAEPDRIKVYEKIRDGIWTINGMFVLVDSWIEKSGNRNVFKFKLLPLEWNVGNPDPQKLIDIAHTRMIPSNIKKEVWLRDKGQCVICGSKDNLHFDHVIPYSRGGSSLLAANIQLMCVRHNLAKKAKIE